MAITRHLFLLFTLLLFTGLSINTYAGPVIVPDVVDTPEADARTTIEEAGLTVGNVSNENSETIVAGNVISQDPAAGTEVEAESAVDLVVSDGPAPVIVPDVVDLSLADATTTLNAAGLDLGNTSEQSDETVPEGDVISQDPAAGTEVAAGSEVDLVISSGPAPVTVPSVTGLNLADATSALEADDLVVGNTSEQSDETVPEGDVISQDPAAGTEVEAGSAVDLVISTGPATVPATVPNVVDDSLAVATGKIEAADLVVGNTSEQSSETVPEGDVISQDPVGGTEVEAGSAVDLVISTGPATVPATVPNVVDDSLAVATGKIEAADLVVGNTSEQSSETVPEGDVISQDPVGGTEVEAGSAVDLVISTGPATVPATVPNVVDDSLAVATGKIEAADLVVGNTSEQSSETVPEGDVISQDPVGGTEVEAGSAVDLVISTGSATVPATVPNVVDDSLAVATGKIEAADLVVGNTSEQSSETVPEGDVISQDPVGGTEVEAGSAVDLVISSGPSGGDNITIDGCDTGVSDPGGIQAGIDQCEANATNHGQFVRCVAIFTKADGVPQSDRKGIMKCAAHSSIDGSEPTALSEGGNVPDNTTGTPAPSSSASSRSSVAVIQNVTIDGRDTGVADSDGSIQASVDACAASATSHRKFVKCVGKVAKSLKRSGDITKREKKRMKKAAKKSSIG